MTLKLIESFDWLESADLPTAYSAFGNVQPTGTMTQTIQEGGGRNGDKALRIVPGSGTNDEVPQNIQGKSFGTGVAAGDTIIVGFAIKVNTFHESGNLIFAAIQSTSGLTTGLYNIILAFTSSKQIIVGYSTVTSNSTITTTNFGGTSTTALVAGIWYYIELKFQSHASTGSFDLRINGVSELAQTGKDTLITDNGVTTLVLGATLPVSTVPSIDFDDVYIADTNGSLNNNFLGDVQVKQLIPNGNGNSSQFVGSDSNSVDNYLLVDDDAAPDDDTTYVESATSSNKDTYTFENLPSTVTSVKAVGVKILGKKVDAGAADMKAVARSSGTEGDSAALGFGTSYTAEQAIYETDPNTSAAWAPSAVDSAEFGVKVA